MSPESPTATARLSATTAHSRRSTVIGLEIV